MRRGPRRGRFAQAPPTVERRVNEQILAPAVRLVDAEGKQLGTMSPREALAIARQQGLDLIEVAPNANPPVCKITDYGHFRYEQRKKDKVVSRKQRTRELKFITLRPNIDTHDLETKIRKLREFLEQGRKVRIMVRFRGPEMKHTDRGEAVLMSLAGRCEDLSTIEARPSLEGRNMAMTLGPKAGAAKPKQAAKKEEKPPSPPSAAPEQQEAAGS